MYLRKIILISAAITSVFFLSSCAKNSTVHFIITDYGAVGNAKTLNTAAINKALSACAKAGGGTVVVPTGTFRTGPLRMFSNTTLSLEAGAILKGSADLNDYLIDGKRFGLISAKDVQNIAIVGRGTIDGSGTCFMNMTQTRSGPDRFGDFDPNFTRQGLDYMDPKFGTADGPVIPRERPGRLVAFSRCKNVLIQDVTITDAPLWTVHFERCNDVVVSGVRIPNPLVVPNNDGIHCTCCSNVLISDSIISAGDDAIAITSIGDPRHQQILGGDALGPGSTSIPLYRPSRRLHRRRHQKLHLLQHHHPRIQSRSARQRPRPGLRRKPALLQYHYPDPPAYRPLVGSRRANPGLRSRQ
jgi:polygalacturonase